VGDRSRGRYATPADFPLHDGTLYRGLQVRLWGLGFVHRSRAIFCRPVPNTRVTICNFFHRCKPRIPRAGGRQLATQRCKICESDKGVRTGRQKTTQTFAVYVYMCERATIVSREIGGRRETAA
jgi:hypothetical protein